MLNARLEQGVDISIALDASSTSRDGSRCLEDFLTTVNGAGFTVIERLSCADLVALAPCSSRCPSYLATSGWQELLRRLPAAFRFLPPTGLSLSQLFRLLPMFIKEDVYSCSLFQKHPQERGMSSARGLKRSLIGGPLIPLFWKTFARQADWMHRAITNPAAEYAMTAYPERWIRERALVACIAADGEVDISCNIEWQAQVRALVIVDDGSCVLFDHHILSDREQVSQHGGFGVAGYSVQAIQEWCSTHKSLLPLSLTQFIMELGLSAEPIQSRSEYEFVNLSNSEALIRKFNAVISKELPLDL
eukprot:TRINITY_DN34254_c0_g1_i1.p1 TRINITY_DN34254_c0_g1~~TRINITY_DN34254_c0_g1_i1.p1  ORF type:complete len:304 (+),score=8.17 TRINITY_DN34254_c0_g1_i1:62-973(+)